MANFWARMGPVSDAGLTGDEDSCPRLRFGSRGAKGTCLLLRDGAGNRSRPRFWCQVTAFVISRAGIVELASRERQINPSSAFLSLAGAGPMTSWWQRGSRYARTPQTIGAGARFSLIHDPCDVCVNASGTSIGRLSSPIAHNDSLNQSVGLRLNIACDNDTIAFHAVRRLPRAVAERQGSPVK
jgi:hypothetical protein